jgi:hypothetical protein
MRKLTMAIAIVSCLVSVSLANLDSGLVAFYHLNGNSNDSIGSNNGIDYNITYSINNGVINQGAYFNGYSSFIQVPYNSALSPTGSFSVSVWIKPSTLVPNGKILGRACRGDGSWYQPYSTFALSQVGPYVEFNIANSSNSYLGVTSSYGSIAYGVWYHIVGVYDGSYLRLYLNGSAVGTPVSFTGVPYYGSNAPLTIGQRSASNSGEFFDGDIDEVGFWNRALSPVEISQLYNLPANNHICIASLADINNNGYPEIISLLVEKNTGNPLIKIFDGGTNDVLKQIYFFTADWTPKNVSVLDIDNDNIQEISVLASKPDSTKIECRKVSDGSLVKTIILQ